jgi:hypothetical protein
MAMWLRLAGAVLMTALLLGFMDYLGLRPGWPPRTLEDIQHDAHVRLRDLFWLAICALVMSLSMVAAARRQMGRWRRSLALSRRRHVR